MDEVLPTMAAGFGMVGLAGTVLWPLLRTRRALLLGQAASAAAFVLHYALIGATTGAWVTTLSIVQAILAFPEHRPRWRALVYLLSAPGLLWATAATWQGAESAFAGAGMALASLGRWGRTAAAVRVPFLLAAGAWAVHDALVLSLPGLGADLLCAATLAAGYRRDRALAALPPASSSC